MTAPLTFAETYPGGRILLMLGEHKIGAVFPPCGDPPNRLPWVWRWWLGGSSCVAKEGRAKTEQAAKNAILAEGRDWLRKAGLQDG